MSNLMEDQEPILQDTDDNVIIINISNKCISSFNYKPILKKLRAD